MATWRNGERHWLVTKLLLFSQRKLSAPDLRAGVESKDRTTAITLTAGTASGKVAIPRGRCDSVTMATRQPKISRLFGCSKWVFSLPGSSPSSRDEPEGYHDTQSFTSPTVSRRRHRTLATWMNKGRLECGTPAEPFRIREKKFLRRRKRQRQVICINARKKLSLSLAPCRCFLTLSMQLN